MKPFVDFEQTCHECLFNGWMIRWMYIFIFIHIYIYIIYIYIHKTELKEGQIMHTYIYIYIHNIIFIPTYATMQVCLNMVPSNSLFSQYFPY